MESILSFHAVTGCDTVSYFAGHSKKTSWKTFTEHWVLLRNLGNGDLDSSTVTSVEKFICRIYSVTEAERCNEARATLFSRCRSPEALPPTSDAMRWHIERAHYQAMIWKQAHVPHPTLPLPESSGWTNLNGKLVPKLMSLVPVPQSCDEMVNCGCKSGCNIQGSVAAGELDCHAQEHANVNVLRTAAAKIVPVQSETKNSKWYSSLKWFSIFENFFWFYFFFNYVIKISFLFFVGRGRCQILRIMPLQ